MLMCLQSHEHFGSFEQIPVQAGFWTNRLTRDQVDVVLLHKFDKPSYHFFSIDNRFSILNERCDRMYWTNYSKRYKQVYNKVRKLESEVGLIKRKEREREGPLWRDPYSYGNND